MKITDLIPLVLLELNEGDKYGLELTKSIEIKSGEKIIIKQPTLYTLLKKLEKSKFIKSYWQDSDIGGKRHYYTLTDNGRHQLSTLPTYDAYLNRLMIKKLDDNHSTEKVHKPNNEQFSNKKQKEVFSDTDHLNLNNNDENDYEKELNSHLPNKDVQILNNNLINTFDEKIEYENFSITDIDSIQDVNNSPILNESQPTNIKENINAIIQPKESIIATNEVFKSEHIDNITEAEINQRNSDILKSEKIKQNEEFATSNAVSRFTEYEKASSNDYKDELKAIYSSALNDNYSSYEKEDDNLDENVLLEKIEANLDDVKYVDYVDIVSDPIYKAAKKKTKRMFLKIMITSVYMLIALSICSAIVSKISTTTSIFYTTLIISVLIIIFYPALFAFNYQRFRISCQYGKYKYSVKRHVLFTLIIETFIIMLCLIINLTIRDNNLKLIFSTDNFADIYFPIIMSIALIVDLIAGCKLVKNNKK